jgi:hypothetical protein
VRRTWSPVAIDTLWIIFALLVLAAGVALFNRWRLLRQRKIIGGIERELAEILKLDKFSIEQTPKVLSRITSLANQLADRVDELDAAGKQPPGMRGREQNHDQLRADLFDVAIAIVRRVVEVLRNYGSSNRLMTQLNASLSLEANLVEAVAALEKGASSAEGGSELVQQLERGELDELLTVGPLLSAYFPSSQELGIVPAALAAVNQLVTFILAQEKVTIKIQSPLSVVEIGTPGIEPFDRRQIRLVEPVRERAARQARTLGDGQLLVVDCTRPGWTAPGRAAREPRSTIFDPASWT